MTSMTAASSSMDQPRRTFPQTIIAALAYAGQAFYSCPAGLFSIPPSPKTWRQRVDSNLNRRGR